MTVMATTRLEDGFEAEIRDLKTQFDVFRYMKRLTERYQMNSFMVLNVPGSTVNQLARASIITSLPAEFMSQFDRDLMLENSPVAKQLRNTVIPFSYDVENGKAYQADKSFTASAELAKKFHLPRGTYFPAHDRIGNRGAVGFFGDRAAFSLIEMLELHMVSTCVYDRIAAIRSLDERPREALSDREIDCLNWTAAGKTSVEIAEIVGLSEHTVNHYLNRATKKLDTVNRTQAVAKALRTGLIS